MLDWLKTILGEAYTPDIDKAISDEIGKAFVSKADFNAANTERKQLTEAIKERDKQLADLKSAEGDAEALKKQIATLQADNKKAAEQYAADLKNVRINAAVDAALTTARAKNVKAVRALLDLTDANIDDKGVVAGLNEKIKALATGADTSFLFDESPGIKGAQPAQSGGHNQGGADKTNGPVSF